MLNRLSEQTEATVMSDGPEIGWVAYADLWAMARRNDDECPVMIRAGFRVGTDKRWHVSTAVNLGRDTHWAHDTGFLGGFGRAVEDMESEGFTFWAQGGSQVAVDFIAAPIAT